MKKFLIASLLMVLALGSVLQAEAPKKPEGSDTSKAPTTPPASLPTPLPAELFQGRAHEAYKAAAEIPEVLAGLKCYCGCDRSMGHRHLLDCFVDNHGAG
jgi:hypothetical protein